jgi:hypothetical protein
MKPIPGSPEEKARRVFCQGLWMAPLTVAVLVLIGWLLPKLAWGVIVALVIAGILFYILRTVLGLAYYGLLGPVIAIFRWLNRQGW